MKKLIIVMFIFLLSACTGIGSNNDITIINLTDENLLSYTCTMYDEDGEIEYIHSVGQSSSSFYFDELLFYFTDDSVALELDNTMYVTNTGVSEDYDPRDASSCTMILLNTNYISLFEQVEDTQEFIYDTASGGFWFKLLVDTEGNITNFYAYNLLDELAYEISDINNTEVTFPTGTSIEYFDLVMMFHNEYSYIINDDDNLVVTYDTWEVTITETYMDFISGENYYRYNIGSVYMDNMNTGLQFMYADVEEHCPTLTLVMISLFKDIYGDMHDIVTIDLEFIQRVI